MGAEQVAWAVIGRTVASILGPHIDALAQRLPLPVALVRWYAVRRYQRSLPDKLRRMPFIYAGMEADVLNDFVSIDVDRRDPSTLVSKAETAAFSLDRRRLLTDRRFVAIIGNAGIGKTTFQRHNILQLISERAEFLHSEEDPIPIYVPLKIVLGHAHWDTHQFRVG